MSQQAARLPWATLWTTAQVRDWLQALAAAELADDHAVYADAYTMAAGYLSDDPPWPLSGTSDARPAPDEAERHGPTEDGRAGVMAAVLADAEASLRAGRLDRALLVLAVWTQARDALLSGEQTWAQQPLPALEPSADDPAAEDPAAPAPSDDLR